MSLAGPELDAPSSHKVLLTQISAVGYLGEVRREGAVSLILDHTIIAALSLTTAEVKVYKVVGHFYPSYLSSHPVTSSDLEPVDILFPYNTLIPCLFSV